MTSDELWWRVGMRGKREIRKLRGRALNQRRGVTSDAGVQLGSGCRLLLEPGARLVLGAGVEIDDGTTLSVSRDGSLELGPGCFVGHHCTLAARNAIVVGSGSFLAELVSVRDHDHDPEAPPSAGTVRCGEVRIGSDVWIGAKATITRGVDIGDRAVIGANAVVTKSLPPDVVAGGIPAHVLREKPAAER